MSRPHAFLIKLEEWANSYRARPARAFNNLLAVLALVAGITLVWEFGFSWRQSSALHSFFIYSTRTIVILVILKLNLDLVCAKSPWEHGQTAKAGVLLAFFGMLYAAWRIIGSSGPELELAWALLDHAVRAYLFVTQGYRLWQLLFSRVKVGPAAVMAVTFALIILAGTGMLMTPKATPPDVDLGFVDALFTAVSATCVTGLVVVDTGQDFTQMGQIVILVLIQIGGLGLMTFVAYFSLALGEGLGLRDRVLLRDLLNVGKVGGVTQVLTFTLLLTVGIEALGAVGLYFSLEVPPGVDPAYNAIFHAISAFCNAGFSLHSDSLVGEGPAALALVSGLIVIGGLGFVVSQNLLKVFVDRVQRKRGRPARVLLQTKVVLVVTGVLLLLGWIVISGVELEGTAFDGMSDASYAIHTLFLSVTARTAGFNSVAMEALGPATIVLFLVWMYVGASPASTGGGLKTSTVAILFASVWAFVLDRTDVELFQRRVPRRLVHHATVLFVGSLLGSLGIVFVLSITEDPAWSFQHLYFEVISALGTVGLSIHGSNQLSTAGRCVIAFAMYLGRLGPLTLLLAMTELRSTKSLYRYPMGNLMIG